MNRKLTEKQEKYLELSKAKVDWERTNEDEAWMLVDLVIDLGTAAALAEAEQFVGGAKVQLADECVWVDENGKEHYGPHEKGYDIYNLNGENPDNVGLR